MSTDYKGYLLKFNNDKMPNSYFTEYSSTPNQRLDSSAVRDNYANLQRSTYKNYKTSITFTTHILNLEEKITFQNIIKTNMSNAVQRKVSVTYWNDETNKYSTGTFYIPDIEFSVMDATDDNIMYNPISVEMIEY